MSVSRREFGSQMTGVVTGAVATGLTAAAPVLAMSAAESKSPQSQSFEDHQVALLKELYGSPAHLTDEMYEGIKGGLRHNRSLAERIRRVSLTHDVPPAFVFPVPKETPEG